MCKAILFDTDGTIIEINFTNTLENLYSILKCNRVTAISLYHDHLLYIDEEGALQSDPHLNHFASMMVAYFGIRGEPLDAHIVGRALLVKYLNDNPVDHTFNWFDFTLDDKM